MKIYPPTFSSGKRYAKRIQSERVDTHQPIRTIFQKGYELAEKDTIERALTWLKEKYWLYGDVSGHDLEDLLDAFKESMEEEL